MIAILPFIARRLVALVPLVFLVSVLAFGLTYIMPGDAAEVIAGEQASAQQVEQVRRQLGMDQPALTQYARWVGKVASGDLGTSLMSSQTVVSAVLRCLPVTISLTLMSVFFAILIGGPAGLLAGLNPGTRLDRLVTAVATVGVALPSFWLGALLIGYFAIQLRWLPALGYVPLTEDPWGWFKHLILPAVTLSATTAAELARHLRASVRDVTQRSFVTVARAKGLRSRAVVLKHILRNASLPVVTVLGLQITALLGGTVVTETVFNMPGIGQLGVLAVAQRDIPVIQGIVLFSTAMVIVINLIVDLSYGLLNPKVQSA